MSTIVVYLFYDIMFVYTYAILCMPIVFFALDNVFLKKVCRKSSQDITITTIGI